MNAWHRRLFPKTKLRAMVFLIFLFACSPLNIPVNDINFPSIKTGKYIGTAHWSQFVRVEVSVMVEQPRVTDIKILKHNCGLGKKAEKIIDKVINSQSLNVDAVSGATVSSKVILKAVEDALKKGLTEENSEQVTNLDCPFESK